jgi:putative phosphotransacetylase
MKIPVEISARHCHLCKADLEKLFGQGYELTRIKDLAQSSDFACEETITITFGTKKIEKVRVVGPLREETQVEISLTDAVGSGVVPPIRLSGQLDGSSPVALEGPKGAVQLHQGLIVALRHIHCATSEMAKFKLKNGDIVSVKIGGVRPTTFHDVSVRVRDDYKIGMHLDTDEGNAAGVNRIGEGEIIRNKKSWF